MQNIVVILGTGGTIAGVAPEGKSDLAYQAAQLGVGALVQAVPELADTPLETEQVAQVDSKDMTHAIWQTLTQRVSHHLARDEVCGVVITHGTDTMEETAYFLNLVVKTDKPVVLVGSMRPSTAVSADGPLNLYNGVGVAIDPAARGRGVLLVMNDWIHAAHSLTKTSTTAVQTFMSPIRGVVGTAAYGKNDFYNNPPWKHTTQSEFSVNGVSKLPRVDIIYGCADMSPDLIDASAAAGAKGIVIAGVGNGNMNKASLDAAARVAKKGVMVVRSTRVATGNVGRNVEVNDDELGLIASDELNPQKARILLALALLKTRTPQEIQRLFTEY
jgi:L-asparaginase